jgi:phosphotransferase system HPr (HPr) family protein
MYEKTTVIINSIGLHARPASDFTHAAKKFKSSVFIENIETGQKARAKSIVMVLGLSLGQGAKVKIMAEGPDEEDAVNTLTALIDSLRRVHTQEPAFAEEPWGGTRGMDPESNTL